MRCPRDGSTLLQERMHGIEVDRCPACDGRWLDHDELDLLESTRADEAERRGTIRYADRPSELRCPVCEEQMGAFNYRAYNLEIDTCQSGHGFWLDAGEEERVRDIIDERVRGLKRSAVAEVAWANLVSGVRRSTVMESIRSFFGGGGRRR